MASSTSSNSSISALQAHYDVFLSFRGMDTRVGFTSHLDAALKGKQILTFIDNNLKRGEEISLSLLKAIEESKLSVIVFSENYASSKWCLDELVRIVECRKKGQIVIPIFYQVDPSHVRNQIGSFGDAFARLLKGRNLEVERVRRWREALKEAANLSGWTSRDDRPESEFIKEIVGDILKELHKISPISNYNGLVGIDARIQKVESLLNIDESQDVRIVGLWGMGGIGKTSIARAVCNNIRNQFEGVFFTNMREELKRHSMIDLQRNFLAQLLGQEIMNVGFVSFGIPFIKDRLRRKKVVIVLDDVDESTQLQEFQELLIRQRDSFCPGSRIIVISRDKQVLKNVVDENQICEVEGLEDHEALQLFSLKAFKSCSAPVDYADLFGRIVDYAKGNPLALIVVGSALYGKSKESWYSAVNKLGKVSNPEILNVLRISYDELDRDQRDIFLDIAYFFDRTDRDKVTKILESCYSSVPSDITILADKSLITIPRNTVGMHDLLREMAFNIVGEESKNPGKRSRLCDEEDVYRVLNKKKGTDSIEGISLDLLKSKEMHLESDAFAGMENLRFLIFYYHFVAANHQVKVHLPHCGLRCLPDELIYLRWDRFPSKSLPPSFCAENLVELDLRMSKIEKLWTGVQNLVNLQRIILSGCNCLIELPDLSKASSLELLDLNYCQRITEVPSHIQYLHKLGYLNLDGCSNITEFPQVPGNIRHLFLSWTAIAELPSSIAALTQLATLNMAACKQLSSLPSSICKLKSLQSLYLCGCCNLESFPEIMEPMEFLTDLVLYGTAIAELPSSIAALTQLAILDMRDCKQLSSLPSSICKLKSLKSLYLSGCCNLESFPEIMEPMECLTRLDLGKTAIAELPSSIQLLPCLVSLLLNSTPIKELPSSVKHLKALERLELQGTPVTHLPELPPGLLGLIANDCESLETIPRNNHETNLEHLNFANCFKLDQKAFISALQHKFQVTNLEHLNFANCFKLDQKALMSALQHKIQSGWLGEEKQFILVGSDIPEWFSDQCVGHSITMRMPVNSHQLKGTLYSVVFAFSDLSNDLLEEFVGHDRGFTQFTCYAKNNNGGQVNYASYMEFNPMKLCEADHMLLWYWPHNSLDLYPKNEYSGNVTFEFYPKPSSQLSSAEIMKMKLPEILKRCEVKKCGVHLEF